jgi:hypothetical protein
MKQKLDFGQTNGFRRDNKPKPILTAQEIATNRKNK